MEEMTCKTSATMEENVKMGLRETDLEGVDWIPLAQNRDRRQAFVNTVMKLRVP
jgi:hypothetical protein